MKLKEASEIAGTRRHLSAGCSDSSLLFNEVDPGSSCSSLTHKAPFIEILQMLKFYLAFSAVAGYVTV
jgi:hypothetical protein